MRYKNNKRVSVGIQILILCVLTTIICSCSSQRRKKTETDKQTTSNILYIDAIDYNPIVHVYMENSGSMNGYMGGQTEFENIVYNYLVNLRLAKIPSKLNLFYINSKILRQQDDVQHFIDQLEPHTFKAKGGNIGTSDISQMLSMIMEEMNDSTVSIFISDCIFSPGKGKDAAEYLYKQQTGIKSAIGQYFNEHPNFAVIGYRCMSTFNGYCYDKNNLGKLYKGRRPFYIWMFGTQAALNRIQNEMLKNRFQIKDIENEFVVFAGGITIPDSCYAIKRGSGNFDLKKSDPKHSIEHLKTDKNGKVRLAIDVDYAQYILNDSYLCDTSLYILSDERYRVCSVERIKELSKYTHTIYIESDRVYPTNLEIKLCTSIPTWPELFNDDEGDAISEYNSEKTFGIKYMTNGIAEAILRNNYYTKFTININK